MSATMAHRTRATAADADKKRESFAQIFQCAVLRSHEISPAAFRLYTLICLMMPDGNGWRQITDSEAGVPLHLTRQHVYSARRQLAEKGWIETAKDKYLRPLLGFTYEVETVKFSDASCQQNLTEVSTKFDTVSTKFDRSVKFSDTPPHPPIRIQTSDNSHTHTQTAPELPPPTLRAPLPCVAPSPPPEAAKPRVCVNGSKFSFSERLEHAARQSAITNPQGWAFATRDGTADELIALTLERKRARASPAPPEAKMCFECRNSGTVPRSAGIGKLDVMVTCPVCHGRSARESERQYAATGD
ncbi:MAG: hypothetical protein MSG64_19880 [Pyrinomonadaceae bacterium MAG19_C2-C3]|nr:hypothetical protein [Pyrinomonadaceae bacterium MAG19_C2-C3]